MSSQEQEQYDLTDKYEGVRSLWLKESDKMGLIRPTGMDKLKELYRELPSYLPDGVNEKVGLTNEGYAVYRNRQTDALIYCHIVAKSSGVIVGRKWGRHDVPTRDPHDGFGDGWIIRP